MNPLVLVFDDEPDVEVLFRQQFGATSALAALQWILPNPPPWHSSASLMLARGIAHLNPLRHQHAGDERSRTLAQGQSTATGGPRHHDHRLWRCGDEAPSSGMRR